MKISLGNWFVRLGPSPTEENNFVSIERGSENALIRVSACAEHYDAAIGFYMDVGSGLCRTAQSCWFELQRPRKKIPDEIDKGARMVGYTARGALYSIPASHRIVSLISEFWLTDRFKILGTDSMPVVTAVELANSLGEGVKDAGQQLSADAVFALEKQYFADESLLAILVRNSLADVAYDLVLRSATRLLRPLLDVGPASWPPAG